MADIEIEIDGQKLAAKPNQTVIQVADDAGVYIPRFCYHKNLSIAANCRMCLVEVEKSPKVLPACATPVTPGMKVFTRSQKTIEAQRAVMEFLLINHPLDCPICDQGGECELQDLSMGYGSSHSDYDECKRAVAPLNLGPLIATEMTRCIQCTRCVRFGDEIAGMRELGVTHRGEDMEIETYVQHAMQSEVSGNIIDLCPVGALTSKPFRFTARAWELDQYPSVSPHDCVGSNLYVHTRYGKVMRVVSRENATINETWISDRDRFSYTGLYHEDRLAQPIIRQGNEWKVVEWQEALQLVANNLQQIQTNVGAEKIGALASPNSTCEEFFLLQKLMRSLGSSNVDHRLREIDTVDQDAMGNFPGFSLSLTELENCDAILLIGSNIQKEQPLIGLRVRKASLKGAAIMAINPVDYRFNFALTEKLIVSPNYLPQTLNTLLAALQSNETKDDAVLPLIKALNGKKSIGIVLGALANHHTKAATIRYLAGQIAIATGAKINFMTDGANSAGAWLAGCIPHRASHEQSSQAGLSAYEMLKNPRAAYLLLNVEPELDTANAQMTREALAQAQFVVALSTYLNPTLEKHAHVILPTAAFTETSGTFVNAFGEWQSFNGVAKAFYSSRPAWKILRVLGNFLNLNGFDYESAEQIKHELKTLVEKQAASIFTVSQPKNYSIDVNEKAFSRIGEIPIYATDNLVRRALPLQATQKIIEGESDIVRIHPDEAFKLKLQNQQKVIVRQAEVHAELIVQIDARIPLNAAWIAGGVYATSQLGDLFGNIEIKPAE